MKARVVVYSVVLWGVSMFAASVGFAECPDGKIEVTIFKGKSGKTMTICVNEAAVPHIGGPSDVVIPAVCPCDVALLEPPADWVGTGSCDSDDYLWFDRFILRGSDMHALAQYNWRPPDLVGGYCWFDGPGGEVMVEDIGPDEAHACAAQVSAFAVYELGLGGDCVVVPDFEP